MKRRIKRKITPDELKIETDGTVASENSIIFNHTEKKNKKDPISSLITFRGMSRDDWGAKIIL